MRSIVPGIGAHRKVQEREDVARSVADETHPELAAAVRTVRGLTDRPDDQHIEIDRRPIRQDLNRPTDAADRYLVIGVQAESTKAHVENGMGLARASSIAPGDDDACRERGALGPTPLGSVGALGNGMTSGCGTRRSVRRQRMTRGWDVACSHRLTFFTSGKPHSLRNPPHLAQMTGDSICADPSHRLSDRST